LFVGDFEAFGDLGDLEALFLGDLEALFMPTLVLA
jgi:hypothetical protein